MRTNSSGVTENAEFKIDKEKFDKNFVDVFGNKPSPFCDLCEKRHSFCECKKTDKPYKEKNESSST